jgi:hypothetical protein
MRSRSGNYVAFGGSVDAACIQADFNFAYGVGLHVNVRVYGIYSYNGRIYNDANHDQGFGGGWTFYDRDTGYANGNSDGWTDALNSYLATGGCSANWDIWIDYKVVCRDGEHVDQS